MDQSDLTTNEEPAADQSDLTTNEEPAAEPSVSPSPCPVPPPDDVMRPESLSPSPGTRVEFTFFYLESCTKYYGQNNTRQFQRERAD